MNQIIRIGMDTSKHIFQLHGVDAPRACCASGCGASKCCVFCKLPDRDRDERAGRQLLGGVGPARHEVKLIGRST